MNTNLPGRPDPGAGVAACVAFVVSGAMLAYEILLTRLASVLLTSQYLFVVLGVALLGIAAGAATDYQLAARRDGSLSRGVGAWVLACGLALVAALLLVLKVGPQAGLAVLAVSAGLPFAAAGLVMARLFRRHPEATGQLYAADLLGAASGALSVPALLPSLGPVSSILLLAVLLAAAGAALLSRRARSRWRLLSAVVPVTAIVLFLASWRSHILGDVPVGADPDKDLYRLTTIAGGAARLVESRWSTFGRTDLVRFGDDTSVMSLFIDGAAGTAMLRFDGNFSSAAPAFVEETRGFPGIVPLVGLPPEQRTSALIIGAGGGRDVLLALIAGFGHITAVDVNPDMVALVRKYASFNGDLYGGFPNVRAVVQEGRAFVRRNSARYDLIILFMPVTKSSRSLNAFALTEGYLFTREAFRDYWRHLSAGGRVVIMAHSMPEATRLLVTAVTALQDEGATLAEAMRHVYVLGSTMMPLFGLEREPPSPARSRVLHAATDTPLFDARLSYVPGVRQAPASLASSPGLDASVQMMNPLFERLAAGSVTLAAVGHGLGFDLSAPSDDRPFFFQYAHALPDVVVTVFWIAAAALLALFLARRFRPTGTQGGSFGAASFSLGAFFALTGMGYIVIELALFQRTVFYLGDPSRTLAVLLAALLSGSGLGSLLSRRWRPRRAVAAGFGVAVIAAGGLFGLPLILDAGWPGLAWPREGVAALAFLAQGLPMGVLLPAGLRLAHEQSGGAAVPWLWAVNGAASVAGAAAAAGLAMVAGYSWALLFGAACYLAADSVLSIIARRERHSLLQGESAR